MMKSILNKKSIRIKNNHPLCPHDKNFEEYLELYKSGGYIKVVTRFRMKDPDDKKWKWSNECECYPKISVEKIRNIL